MNNTLKGHQGDVQFKSLEMLPEGATMIAHKPIALGEHSGHMHVLTGQVQLFELGGRIFAAVGDDGARLQHCHESNFSEKAWASKEEIPMADHQSHLLPSGVYEFYIQNSYNPLKKAMEQVID